MKDTACGIVFTDGEWVLGCLPTTSEYFDLPKGKKEKGETKVDAAIRETYEETSIEVSKEKIDYAGSFNYREDKQIVLYVYLDDYESLPPIHKMECNSYFKKVKTEIPEMRAYEYIHSSEIENRFYPKLAPIIFKVLNKLEN